MKIKQYIITILVIVILSPSVFATGDSEGMSIRLAHAMPLDHPVAVSIERMATQLEKETNGRIKITIFGNAQLGGERALVEQVQKGGIDIVKLGASNLENFSPVYGTLSMPYLFESTEQYYSFIKGPVGREFLDILNESGLEGLTFYDAGSRNFYAKKPIRSPSDLQGLTIRTIASNTAIAMVEAMGGAATPIAFAELYSALQQGVVDGAENNVSSYVTTRHMEIAKYFSFDHHSRVPDVLVMNKKKFDALSQKDKDVIMKVVKDSLEYQIKLWNEAEYNNRVIAEAQGSEFFEVDPQPFMEAVAPLYDDLSTEKKEWVKKIRSIK